MKNNLKTIRESMGLTHSELAMMCGMAVPSIIQLEQGIHAPNLRTAYGISKILGKNIYHIWPNEMKVVTKTVKTLVP